MLNNLNTRNNSILNNGRNRNGETRHYTVWEFPTLPDLNTDIPRGRFVKNDINFKKKGNERSPGWRNLINAIIST